MPKRGSIGLTERRCRVHAGFAAAWVIAERTEPCWHTSKSAWSNWPG